MDTTLNPLASMMPMTDAIGEITLSQLAVCRDVPADAGAGLFLDQYITSLGTNYTQFANVLGVNASTVKRLCDGAALTVELAAKLSKRANLCPSDLFTLEAARKSAETKKLINQDAHTLQALEAHSQKVCQSMAVPAHLLGDGGGRTR